MPKKQTVLTDEERAKRVREAARKIGADDKEAFEHAFKKIVPSKNPGVEPNNVRPKDLDESVKLPVLHEEPPKRVGAEVRDL